MKWRSSEKGRPRASTILDNRVSKKELNMKCCILRHSQCGCRHCIKGLGREEDCRKSINEARQVPEIHLEYMFMGDEEERNTLAIMGG